MKHKALVRRLQISCLGLDHVDPLRLLVDDVIAALAQHDSVQAKPEPEQEPVAYAVYHRMGGSKSLHWPEQHSPNGDESEYRLVPLYATPPQRKPLTDEEMKLLWAKHGYRSAMCKPIDGTDCAHGIKE